MSALSEEGQWNRDNAQDVLEFGENEGVEDGGPPANGEGPGEMDVASGLYLVKECREKSVALAGGGGERESEISEREGRIVVVPFGDLVLFEHRGPEG